VESEFLLIDGALGEGGGQVLQNCGFWLRLELERAVFYPQGGGEIQAQIRAVGTIAPLQRTLRGEPRGVRGISATANLSDDIARRQKHQALRRLEPLCRDSKIESVQLPSPGKGTLLPLAFASGISHYRTAQVTRHLLTNAEIIHAFLYTRVQIDGNEGQPGLVTILPGEETRKSQTDP
jgi:RNA 3'-terminal phosphate cyclase